MRYGHSCDKGHIGNEAFVCSTEFIRKRVTLSRLVVTSLFKFPLSSSKAK